MKNIILVGKICAGKDTFASYLSGYRPLALGDEIRLLVHNLRVNGVDAAMRHTEQLLGFAPGKETMYLFKQIRSDQPSDTKDRYALQTIGTHLRQLRDDVWINVVKEKSKKFKNIVITDVRRFNEFKAFDDYVSVYIEADKELRKQRAIARDGTWKDEWDINPAEAEIEMLSVFCNYLIFNEGTSEGLEIVAKALLKELSGIERVVS